MKKEFLKQLLFTFLVPLFCLLLFHAGAQMNTSEVLPTNAQLAWADAEIGVLIHFDVQVFKPEYEWRRDMGNHPSPSVFNPTRLSTDQWMKAARDLGAKYGVLVAKHCSGFSLWPTEVHEYSIKNSPYKNGDGDIVGEFVESCKKYGVKPGIYASTTANGYLRVDNPGKVLSGDPEEQQRYNNIVKKQLTELWTNYGPLFEIWFDGGVLPPSQGGFDILSMVQEYQPNAIAFQGPFGYKNNIRWVGNEEGIAPYPCWARADSTTSASGIIQIRGLNGNPDGQFWCPGEADFPLRRNNTFGGGWFWHEGEDDKIFSMEELKDKYIKSVGRNTNMLLGIVIDDRGLVPEADVKRMQELGKWIKKTFARPVAQTSGKGTRFELNAGTKKELTYAVIREETANGENIREYELKGKQNGKWETISRGTCVGHKRIEEIHGTFDLIQLNVTKNVGPVTIKHFILYGGK
jgi:alpha-L-fucosidase